LVQYPVYQLQPHMKPVGFC